MKGLAPLVEGFEPAGAPGAMEGSLLAIPGYTVTEELARGGMGIVYRARQHAPSRVVALKMLLPFSGASTGLRERFQQEARTLSELDHPAILPIYETGEHGHLPWFSMKLATGGSLAERISSFAGCWKEIAGLMIRVAEAVQYAHDHGVLHRDLKPGNLLFDGDGRGFVADFGLAKLIRPGIDLTQSHRAMGTPHYLAPEVAATHAGRATTASDVYSLGAILFELLTGRPPFEAEGIPALLRRIVEQDPAFPASVPTAKGNEAPVPRDLEVVTLKCLAKDPACRYPSPRELAEELRRYLAGEPILARPLGSTDRVLRWCRHQPALASAVAGVALLLVSLTVVFALSSRRIERLRLESLAQLYAADMRLAQQALAESKFGAAAEFLERHQPRPGDPDLRGFEWWHLQDRCRSEESASLGAVAGPAQRLAFSSDGRWVAAAGTDLLVWDARDRRILFRKPVGDFVWALAVSPEGSHL
jgi:serine/threonine-protein kinase